MARVEARVYRVVLPEELPLQARERLLLEHFEQRQWVLLVHRLLSRQLREREVQVWWCEPHVHLRGYSPLEVLPQVWKPHDPEACLLEACAMMPYRAGSRN